jgi:hypothetical protein
MSQFYNTGPAELFAGVDSGSSLTFLGWSQSGFELRFMGSFRDVIADFSGPEVPADVQYMGELCYITGTLSKYNEAVLQAVMARAVGVGTLPGQIIANELGSLMVAQELAYPIVINAPYAGLAFQSATAIPGWQFFACYLDAEASRNVSVIVQQPRVTFRAIPIWNSSALTSQLYTNTIPSLPPIN